MFTDDPLPGTNLTLNTDITEKKSGRRIPYGDRVQLIRRITGAVGTSGGDDLFEVETPDGRRFQVARRYLDLAPKTRTP